jgi:hypothetical protein
MAGFGLVAYPVRYGVPGATVYIVSREQDVCQQDLCPGTVAAGRA